MLSHKMVKIVETVTDAIAIEILNQHAILIGRGNELHLFSRKHDVEIMKDCTLDIRLSDKIHGIIKDSLTNKLLIYGGKEFALLQINSEDQFRELHRYRLTDWISAAKFLTNKNQVILLTAHSIILRFEYEATQGRCSLIERVSCSDKSTLYCSHLNGCTWEDVVVFGGNAYGELLIWKPNINVKDSDKDNYKHSSIMHRITAHNGVLFSIDYDQETKFLITTSDDRSMKWWKIDSTCDDKWTNCTVQPLSNSYGHVARVFCGRIIKDGTERYAISVGEDSYLCLWHNNGDLLFKRRQQFGAVIWNFAYDTDNKMVYTVGSCGNVIGFSLRHALESWNQPKYIEQPRWRDQSTESTPSANSEYITKIKFYLSYQLICLTSENRLLQLRSWCEDFSDGLKCHFCIDRINFKCTAFEVLGGRVALCGHQRCVVYAEDMMKKRWIKLYDGVVLSGVIRAFFFLTLKKYLLSDDQGNCVIIDGNESKHYFKLPGSKETWLTAARILSLNHFVVSNRQGHLLLYKNYKLVHSLKHLHGNLGATKLELQNETEEGSLIFSVGHSNVINWISVDYVNCSMKVSSRKIVPMAWVANMKVNTFLSHLLVGFDNNHFVVWSSKYDVLMQVPCGGGHRCWDFADTLKLAFVFIKNKKLYTQVTDLKKFEPMFVRPALRKWHTKSCNVAAVTQKGQNIVMTGGEDNLLKIHQISSSGLKEIEEFHGHISNIKAIKVITSSANELLVFSGGGRAQLCVTKMCTNTAHMEEVISYTIKTKQPSNIRPHCSSVPETRITALDVHLISKHNPQYGIYVGCSDGYVRLLHFDVKQEHMKFVAELFYNKCILHVRILREENCIIVASTDGTLKFYDKALKRCLYDMRHHQSGVNALDINYAAEKRCLQILTGGDDQAVCYSELNFADSETDWKLSFKFNKPFWHMSQVTAVCIMENGLYGLSGGLDQNINKIHLQKDEIVETFHSTIADIKGIVIWYQQQQAYAIVYGCGYQIFLLNE